MRSKGIKRQANYHKKMITVIMVNILPANAAVILNKMLNYLRFSALYESCFLPAFLCS